MTERELRADLRALVQRWETTVAQLRSDGEPMDSTSPRAEAIDDCIDDVKELLV